MLPPTNPPSPADPANSKDPDEKKPAEIEGDPLLSSLGSGGDIWADEHADEYVNRLRENWD
jgi:hypothetical protein